MKTEDKFTEEFNALNSLAFYFEDKFHCIFTTTLIITVSLIFLAESIDFIGFFMVGSFKK